MVHDLTSNITVKIRFIHGAVAAKGRECGIPALYDTPVVNLIPSKKHLAAKGEGP
jgi:ketopantoate reductase